MVKGSAWERRDDAARVRMPQRVDERTRVYDTVHRYYSACFAVSWLELEAERRGAGWRGRGLWVRGAASEAPRDLKV